MFGLIVWCIIIFLIFNNARKKNEENKRHRDRLQQQAAQQQTSSSSSSKTNRALQSVRQAMQQMQQVQPPYESPQEQSVGQTAQQSTVPQKQMPIETRRRQQQNASDRSRIHQNLHRKEADGEREKAMRAAAEHEPRSSYEIRFGEGELMDEVYDIMACGYPSARSGQRDFIAEGQALLNSYL